jgi:hypothetical protein
LGVVDGVVDGFGVEYDLGGVLGVAGLRVENDRLPELVLGRGLENDRLLAAKTGPASTPSANTSVSTRVMIRLTQVLVRMVSHPPAN